MLQIRYLYRKLLCVTQACPHTIGARRVTRPKQNLFLHLHAPPANRVQNFVVGIRLPVRRMAVVHWRVITYRHIIMKLEIVERLYTNGKTQLTLVNSVTRHHVGSLSPRDNYFTSQRIVESVNLYEDLLQTGLLKLVLDALEKRLAEQQI